jgi:hypothetical protein
MGQSRLNQPVLPTIRCLLCTESDLIVARMRNDAKGHVWTHAPQQESVLFDKLVRDGEQSLGNDKSKRLSCLHID